jgi:alpha-L-rhamnosidase
MRKIFLLSLLLFSIVCYGQVSITKLYTENLINPIGLGSINPRFTWQMQSNQSNVMQSAYEITVTSGKREIWNSGKVLSDQSVHVPYSGSALSSGLRYYWKVRVWDNKGKVSAWSKPALFQMGLLKESDWKAEWIEPGFQEDPMQPSPLFRKEFKLTKKLASATAYISAHGLYEAKINGQRVGEGYLTPGWTNYNKRIQYQAYDVTSLLLPGSNAVGVMLGSGWYRGIIGYMKKVFDINVYGRDIALILQIDLQYSDGSKESIYTDSSWKSSTGEVLYSEIFNGEIVDARLEQKGWTNAGFNDAKWFPVKVGNHSKTVLIPTINELVKKQESLIPLKIIKTPKGEMVIDFGQNLSGFVTMKVQGNAGDTIKLEHAEVLDQQGNFYTANLRSAKQTNIYILKGGMEEIFEPRFTWQGFRYVKVEGYPGEIKAENFTVHALYSDMEESGTFITSHEMINHLQRNILWGMKSNFIDVPIDCPQRDERLGWTGDAQVFARTAAFNMNVNNVFARWLQDLESEQIEGKVPHVIPHVVQPENVNSAGWADASTIIPWDMYVSYGDRELLARQYNSMKAFHESVKRVTINNLWNSGKHHGDWLFYSPIDDKHGMAAVTDKYLIAQCFYAHSTQNIINAARVLVYKEDEESFTKLLHEIKTAFLREYMTPGGRLVSNTQTAYILALQFDMLPEEYRQQAADRLAENIRMYGHLTTGFLGTPYINHVLTRFAYADLAYELLLNDKYPSWLFPITKGATTIWERWDGIKPDGSFQNRSMNSFNHYAYGAIGDWMYRAMAGINTTEDKPGYKHSFIKPHIGGGLTGVSATLETYYGKISSSWKIQGSNLIFNVEIPVNTESTVYIPTSNPGNILINGRPLSQQGSTFPSVVDGKYVRLELGSGKYEFKTEL